MAQLRMLQTSMRFNQGEVIEVERDVNCVMADTLVAQKVAEWVGEPHPASKSRTPARPRAKVVQSPVMA